MGNKILSFYIRFMLLAISQYKISSVTQKISQLKCKPLCYPMLGNCRTIDLLHQQPEKLQQWSSFKQLKLQSSYIQSITSKTYLADLYLYTPNLYCLTKLPLVMFLQVSTRLDVPKITSKLIRESSQPADVHIKIFQGCVTKLYVCLIEVYSEGK